MKRTVSLPTHVLEIGLKRCKEQNRSFSNYVTNLIDNDQESQRVEAQEKANQEEKEVTA